MSITADSPRTVLPVVWMLLASAVLIVAGCESLTTWFAPNPTCADWQHLAEDKRTMIVEQVVRDGSLFEAVRVAQQAPLGTSNDDLVSMAVGSVTKNCDLQRWSRAVLVKDILRDLYARRAYAPTSSPATSTDPGG
jgi:hypothetical protein